MVFKEPTLLEIGYFHWNYYENCKKAALNMSLIHFLRSARFQIFLMISGGGGEKLLISQPVFTFSKSTMETPEQCEKSV